MLDPCDTALLPFANARRPAPRGPRFALVAATDQLQFALGRIDKRTLTIASSLDAEFLLEATATGHDRRTKENRPCRLQYPFPIRGIGVRQMSYLSGHMLTLRAEFAATDVYNRTGLARMRDILWIWPPALRDPRRALSARATLEAHPAAKWAWLVLPPELAAAWHGAGWPFVEA